MDGAASVTKRRMFPPFTPSGQSSFIELSKNIALEESFTFCRVSHVRINTSPGLSHFRMQ